MDLEEKIRSLPTTPGVYLYKNADGVVIYVGKAKNLRSIVCCPAGYRSDSDKYAKQPKVRFKTENVVEYI